MRWADIHGDQVVFTSEGDLWLGDRTTGKAHRLTNDAGTEYFARFSPDGSQIAFMGEYDGAREAYVMPSAGGTPKRLTYHYIYATVQDWTADGKNVIYRTRGYPESYQIKMVPAAGGAPVDLPLEWAVNVGFAPSGDRYAFTRFNRATNAWFHYIGGMQNQIWVGDLGGTKFAQITDIEGTNEFPVWAGDNVYFANMVGNTFTVMSTPADGGDAKKVAGPYDLEVRDLNTDGKTLIYQKGRNVETVDLATGEISNLRFEMVSDLMHMRPIYIAADKNVLAASISKTGKRVFVETRGQIVSLPVGDGEARLWKAENGVRLRLPKMSPDAKKIAFLSDKGGEQQLYVADADGSNEKQVTKKIAHRIVNYEWSPDGKKIAYNDSDMLLRVVDVASSDDREITRAYANWDGTKFGFSPDSKWIVYSQVHHITQMGRLVLYEIATDQRKFFGGTMTDDQSPVFSTDGKYIVFLSRRNFTVSNDAVFNQLNTTKVMVPCLLLLTKDQKSPLALKDATEVVPPKEEEDKKDEEKKDEEKKDEEKKDESTKIDLDGLYQRLVQLPVAAGAYTSVRAIGDRLLLQEGAAITFFDISKKSGGTLTSGSMTDVSADGKKLLVSNLRVVDVSGKDVPTTKGKVSFGGLRIRIDPPAEWRQMYWDAWRHLRDYFYVANMHGNDWDAIGAKYEKYLPDVRSRDELDELIRWMQAELGSSHQYLRPGDMQSIKPMTPGASLGIDLEPDASGYYKIKRILRGDGVLSNEMSPLAAPGLGVKDGDFLIAVGGVPAKVGSDFLGSLAGRAGQIVSVKVNSEPTTEGARTVFVKPVANETRMRLVDWVAKQREYVSRKTNGEIGYIYLAAMGNGDVSDFIRQYYPQRNKKALVIDTRYNNGGWVQSIILDILDEKLGAYFNMRGSTGPWTRQSDYFAGPMACLINEFNVSNGEEFPHRWRGLDLGPLIGRRTYGGEVGSSPGWPLIDGGVVQVPNYGMYTLEDGWVVEGAGVSPDIDVPSDPNLFVKGIDPQLDRAIAYLQEQVKKNPAPQIKDPKDRVRVGGGGSR